MVALLFPGQGSQELGMGQELAQAFPEARAVFDEVDDALGQSLTSVMWGEDLQALTATANAQPAIMATSVAAYRALESVAGASATWSSLPSVAAGHSLGGAVQLVSSDLGQPVLNRDNRKDHTADQHGHKHA